ncbi:MAG: CxxxxCH/CxxCH domain c-type cytochrome [Anaeromyxobacteraceae bacterium]
MNLDRIVGLAFAAALAALGACGTARNVDQALTATTCTSCHGGTDNTSGAPPNDLHGHTATTERGVGQHTAHVAAGIACTTCHPERTALRTPGHLDGHVDVALSGLAAAGGSAPAPTYDAATATCSNVYCHGATLPSASPRAAPKWTAPFATARCASCHDFPPTAGGHPQATDCATCHPGTVDANGALTPGGQHLNGVVDGIAQHPSGYASRASAAFHGLDAVTFLQGQLGVRDCKACHGADLGGGVGPSCTACHAAAGWTTPPWQANCTFCHGTPTKAFVAARDLGKAAPPQDVGGASAGAKVGAHQQHLGSAIASPVACATCHPVPAADAPLAHVDGTAAVVALPGDGAYDRKEQTCATACHGVGGSPAWTSTAALACTGCHGAPPATGRHPGNEPKHAFMGANCGTCHADVAGVLPNLIGKALHVNGQNDVRLGVGTYDAASKTCATACHGTLVPRAWANP